MKILASKSSLPSIRLRAEGYVACRGMTLVELIVGLAITTLMTIAGWRAIETLQTARDTTQRDVAAWQALDTLFETMEADLRRADLRQFRGSASGFDFRLNALAEATPAQTARYRSTPTDRGFRIVRETSDGSVAFVDVANVRFTYHARDPQTFLPVQTENTASYPRAIELTLSLIGNDSTNARDIRRVMALQ
jgi:prepilin-type N-terminal cleavage/methylation domain-containing protein